MTVISELKTKPIKAKRKGFARRIGLDSDASFEERRLMVLRTAAREFLKNGIAKTSIDVIAAQMDVTKPTIYHYGRSKDELVRECLRYGSQQLAVTLEKLAAEKMNGLERLKRFFRIYTDGMSDDFCRLIVTINPRALSPEGKSEYGRARRNFIELVKGFIAEGVVDGSVRAPDVTMAALTLIGAFNFIPQWHRDGGQYTPEQVFTGMMDVFLGGLDARR